MNRNDIIRMAREADLWMTSDERVAAVERFAKLVYKRVWNDTALAATHTVTDAAIALEREACAKVCEAKMPQPVVNWADAQIVEALRDCAAAIRARSSP